MKPKAILFQLGADFCVCVQPSLRKIHGPRSLDPSLCETLSGTYSTKTLHALCNETIIQRRQTSIKISSVSAELTGCRVKVRPMDL